MFSNGSGFSWNEEHKYIDCEQAIFTEWKETHPNAKGLKRRKPFPHYDALSEIFLQDRASEKDANTPADEEKEIEAEENDNLNCDVDGLDNIDGSFDGDDDIDATNTYEQESSQVNSARATNSSKKKSRRQSDGIGSSMSSMAGALNKFIDDQWFTWKKWFKL